ncbi:hypothetical protein KR009_003279 [Drosophila setifemur]|nr:hypothetical protein KR009_003279 [Drosophila setifemur]
MNYFRFSFEKNEFLPEIVVAYAPDTNAAINKLMESVMGKISMGANQSIGFKNCDYLRAGAISEEYLANICFHDMEESMDDLPQQLRFAIILSSEFRLFEQTWISDKWKSSKTALRRGFSDRNKPGFGLSKYIDEGFITLQYHISMEYLRTMQTTGGQLPKVLLNRLDAVGTNNAGVVSVAPALCIVLGFMFGVVVLVKLIVEERQCGQAFLLQMSNVSAIFQLVAWFFNSFCQLVVSLFVISILLKIKWNGSICAFEDTPWILVVTLFVSYGFSVSGFVVLISTVMRSARAAVMVVPLVWILLPLPFLSANEVVGAHPHPLYVAATLFLCNVTLSRGLLKFVYFDEYPGPLTYRQLLFAKVMKYDYELVDIFLCFYIQTGLCVVLALFINCLSNQGYKRLIIFIYKLRRALRRRRKRKTLLREAKSSSESSDNRNQEDAAIRFFRVWKKYTKSFVVRNISLSVYTGEVVVLLGPNASGKSTLMKMVCGLMLPSFGKMLLSGHNIQKSTKEAYKRVGMCLPFNTLYMELSVYDHLIFLCRLRGMKLSAANRDVRSYLRSLQMDDMAKIQIRKLTVGQQLLVQALCAFAGRTKVVLLDMPVDGVDEAKQSLFFRFVQEQKRNRSILITTNLSKVASALADRVAILSKGSLIYFGSELSLFKKYKDGYRLVLYVNENCDFDELDSFLSSYIPSIELDSTMGDSLVYRISYKYQPELVGLLEILAKQKEDLNIASFQLHECSLDNLLLNLFTAEQARPELGDAGPLFYQSELLPVNKRCVVFWHIVLVIRKRLLMDIRLRGVALLKIFLPTVVAMWFLVLPYWGAFREPSDNSVFPRSAYSKTGIFFLMQESKDRESLAAGQTYLDQGALVVRPDENIMDHMREYIESHLLLSCIGILGGGRFSKGVVEVLFNHKWAHMTPHCLALMMNALAVGYVGPETKITVELEPLPAQVVHTLALHIIIDHINLLFVTCLCVVYSFIWTVPLLFMSLHRGSRLNYVELTAGMQVGVLVVALLLYDLIFAVLSYLPLNLAVLIFQWDLLMDSGLGKWFVMMYALFVVGFCVLSLNLLISFALTDIVYGYLIVLTVHTTGIVFFIDAHEMKVIREVNEFVMFCLEFQPLFKLVHILVHITTVTNIKEMCSDEAVANVSIYADECKTFPNCCDKTLQEFEYVRLISGVLILILIIWISIFICLISKMVRQSHAFSDWDGDADSKFDQNTLHIRKPNELDDTVIDEKTRVRTLERYYLPSKVLHVEQISVFFGAKSALQRINFMVERNQLFSVFGANGSGKTVLMKAILGLCLPSSGRISCSNKVEYFGKHQKNSRNPIGYSDQESHMLGGLTVQETILMELNIRRLQGMNLKKVTTALCKVFDLASYRFHMISTCSRGVKKRLSIAIALLSNADLILLDDPFTHLDVSNQQTILHLIQDWCSHGHSVVFTCCNTEFSTAAQRMAALGRFGLAAIGDRQLLEHNFYSNYYVVETRIRLRDITREPQGSYAAPGELEEDDPFDDEERLRYVKVCELIERVFPHAVIRLVTFPKAYFWVSVFRHSMAEIVQILRQNKRNFYLFSVYQPSVNSIYLRISSQPDQKNSFVY